MSNLALKLIEGTKKDRDQHIEKIYVLNKVKELVTLPSLEYSSTKEVAEYYEVSQQTIRTIRNRFKTEFESDGVRTLKGDEIKELKSKMLSFQSETIKTKAYLTIYTRRAVLRMGMLLTESPIAEKIREYLLNTEESLSLNQRNNVIKYMGKWTPEIENYVVEAMNKNTKNGIGIYESLNIVAKEIGIGFSNLKAKWYRDGNNKDTQNNKTANSDTVDKLYCLLEKIEHENKMGNELLLEKINNLEEENERLYKGLGKLWRLNKSMYDTLVEVNDQNIKLKQEIVEFKKSMEDIYELKIDVLEKNNDILKRKLKLKTSELQKANSYIAKITLDNDTPVQASKFKMDRNGNLEKVN